MSTAATGLGTAGPTTSDSATIAMEENRRPLTGNEVPSSVPNDSSNNAKKSTGLSIGAGLGVGSGNDASSGTVPGKFGSYVSYIVMIVGMIAAIICRRYSSFPLLGSIKSWTSDCPSGYESSCKANQAVLRFSFAMVILFAVQLIGVTVYPKFYDTLWLPKFIIFVFLVVGFFYADPEVFDNHGEHHSFVQLFPH
jgi:hypothetical protein